MTHANFFRPLFGGSRVRLAIDLAAEHERASGARMHANYFRTDGVHQDGPPRLIDLYLGFRDPFLGVCDVCR
jgi:NADH:ubiquinone oxidoreductase subunit D